MNISSVKAKCPQSVTKAILHLSFLMKSATTSPVDPRYIHVYRAIRVCWNEEFGEHTQQRRCDGGTV